ncbi:MAG: hypothetical protein EON95_06035 [Caulobacteraceae bacterium]|nr:MAG: hypothetical protein EON95_06035 [Caulobacteraceae bacterium]
MRKIMIGLALAGLVAGAALAQDSEVGEVVVTGSRISEYDATQTPHVVLRKRADNLIVQVVVVCDTRDASQRREELKATLRNLIRQAAKDPGVELGLGEEIVGAFDETMVDSIIGSATKVDTSQATLLVKTKVLPGDTLDSATGRIEKFVAATPKSGRTEILVQGEWNLTLIHPEQYRSEVIALIARDSLKSAAAFGDGYGVTAQGLQLPLSWYQSAPLELALYIPYRMEVRPK